jgi:hypothetical protein
MIVNFNGVASIVQPTPGFVQFNGLEVNILPPAPFSAYVIIDRVLIKRDDQARYIYNPVRPLG